MCGAYDWYTDLTKERTLLDNNYYIPLVREKETCYFHFLIHFIVIISVHVDRNIIKVAIDLTDSIPPNVFSTLLFESFNEIKTFSLH
jgi:hypothetical protein